MKDCILHKLRLGVLAAVLAVCLSGCMFATVDKLYALPVLPQEYRDLQSAIETAMNELGAEYATISYGSNTSTIQLLDLDGDGEQETAAVFLRVTSAEDAEERPMRVCLFRQGSDNTYRQTHMLSGDGTSINSVAYEDLTGDGSREIIVSWQLSGGVHILAAYNLTGSEADELMSSTYNESYIVTDLDGDGGQEIVVFQQDSTGEGNNRAEYYEYQDGVMTLTSVALLSDGMRDVANSEVGYLADGRLGVYVGVELVENGMLTDILVLEEGGLVNITRDVESGASGITARAYTEVGATDINNDGVIEIPRPQPLTPTDPESTSTQYLIYWQQFDSRGKGSTSCITYHAVSDSWYLNLPNGWDVGNITVARDDSLSSRGERAVVFYYWPDRDGEGKPEKFLTIYRLTGNNRNARSKLAGRTTLYTDSTATYCAVLDRGVWDCGMDEEGLAQRFRLIMVEWANKQRSTL